MENGKTTFEREPGWPRQGDVIKVVLNGGHTFEATVVQDTGKVFKLDSGEIIPNHSVVYWKLLDRVQTITIKEMKEECQSIDVQTENIESEPDPACTTAKKKLNEPTQGIEQANTPT